MDGRSHGDTRSRTYWHSLTRYINLGGFWNAYAQKKRCVVVLNWPLKTALTQPAIAILIFIGR